MSEEASAPEEQILETRLETSLKNICGPNTEPGFELPKCEPHAGVLQESQHEPVAVDSANAEHGTEPGEEEYAFEVGVDQQEDTFTQYILQDSELNKDKGNTAIGYKEDFSNTDVVHFDDDLGGNETVIATG